MFYVDLHCHLLPGVDDERRRSRTRSRTSAAIVRSGQAFCLASDGHPGTREHTLQLGFHLLLRAGASSVHAWRLTQANPRFLLRSGTSSLELDEPAVA